MIFTGKALDQNFVFASLDNAEKKVLASAMEKQLIRERENIITQGKNMTVEDETLTGSTATATNWMLYVTAQYVIFLGRM